MYTDGISYHACMSYTVMILRIVFGVMLYTKCCLCDSCTSVSHFRGVCSLENIYKTIQHVGLTACQRECSIRLKCAAINYNFNTLTCELLHSQSTNLSSSKHNCAYMTKGQWQTDLDLCKSSLCDSDTACLSVKNARVFCVTEDERFLEPSFLQIKNSDLEDCIGISPNDSTKAVLQPCTSAPVWNFVYKTELPAFTIKYSGHCLKLVTSCADPTLGLECVELGPCSVYDIFRWTPVHTGNGSVQLHNVKQPSSCLCFVDDIGIHSCGCSDTDSTKHFEWRLKSSNP